MRDVCIITAGNVDSGKSSFLGVLCHNILDDGKGYARSKVSRHRHEIESGRTSDISTKNLKIDDTKNIILVDLCGHEKYLKTTLFGITGYFPDYGILIVSANEGMQPMTKEHLGIILYMKIPFIVLVTRIDIAPKNIYERTILSIKRILKKNNCNKTLISLNSDENDNENTVDTIKYAKIMKDNDNIVPMISISNKTGYGLNIVKTLISNLEPREFWKNDTKGSVFYIDSSFNPPGVGIVVCGVLKGETIKPGMELLIGPYGKEFVPIRIWSIHDNMKNSIPFISEKQHGCLAFRVPNKKIEFNRSKIRKGMVIISKDVEKNVCFVFQAIIKILNHSTTITNNYSPVIHCGCVSQSAKIELINDQKLKIGDTANVNFRFKIHPEFLEIGETFFFREGTTRGVGTITGITPLKYDSNPADGPKKIYKKNNQNQKINII